MQAEDALFGRRFLRAHAVAPADEAIQAPTAVNAQPWAFAVVCDRPTLDRVSHLKIGARVVSHGRHVVFHMAEAAVPRNLFAEILG